METALSLTIGISIGLSIGFLIGKLLSIKANGTVKTLTERIEQTIQRHKSEMSVLQESHEKERDLLKEQLESEQRHAEQLRKESDKQWNERLDAMRQEVQRVIAEQQHTVAALREETAKIGTDAANLTKALKGDTKLQGCWGEMVLEGLLERSGLRKGEEFLVQSNIKGETGNLLRPDVIVRLPGNRNIIVDSKVSLTAYSAAVSAEKEEDRNRHLKEHVQSLKKHVDELAGKNYDKAVDGAIGYVLMFVPIESCLIAAIENDPELYNYAYDKKIIIVSPTSLLMTLQIAYNLWQSDRQSKNVENVMNAAADLYDKTAVFQKTFMEIGDKIKTLSKVYETAQVQFCQGNGNIIRRVENLKSLGVTPHKQLRTSDGSE